MAGGGEGGDSMMDLLGKMSEAYMAAKKENNELKAKVATVEAENTELKKKVAKLLKKVDKFKHQGHQGDSSAAELPASADAAAAAAAVAAAVKAAEAKDTTKSVRARIREEEMKAAEKREAERPALQQASNGQHDNSRDDAGPPLAYKDFDDSRR